MCVCMSVCSFSSHSLPFEWLAKCNMFMAKLFTCKNARTSLASVVSHTIHVNNFVFAFIAHFRCAEIAKRPNQRRSNIAMRNVTPDTFAVANNNTLLCHFERRARVHQTINTITSSHDVRTFLGSIRAQLTVALDDTPKNATTTAFCALNARRTAWPQINCAWQLCQLQTVNIIGELGCIIDLPVTVASNDHHHRIINMLRDLRESELWSVHTHNLERGPHFPRANAHCSNGGALYVCVCPFLGLVFMIRSNSIIFICIRRMVMSLCVLSINTTAI